MKIFRVDQSNQTEAIAEAVSVLRSGGIVIYPTETTYGVAVDVENFEALQKLLAYKGNREKKPISVAVLDQEMAEKYVTLNDTAKQVYKTFLPGPVTVVSTGKGERIEGVTSESGGIGIRIPKHDLALSLISAFGQGITATGANASNKKRPYAIQDILDNTSQEQQNLVDLVLDIGELPHNEPSTVIDTMIDDIVVLRQGQAELVSTQTSVTQSEDETVEWFSRLVRTFRSYYGYTPVLFLFSGEMGAGKTHAVKGMAKGLGISEPITSPTYAIANEYTFENESSPCVFVHIDCWKTPSFDSLKDIGIDDYIDKKAVLAIEWADRFSDNWNAYAANTKIIHIDLQVGANETERIISYSL